MLLPLRWMLYQGAAPVVLPRYVIASLDVAGGRLADSDLTAERIGDLAVDGARVADLEED
jgi:hypothetical protein